MNDQQSVGNADLLSRVGDWCERILKWIVIAVASVIGISIIITRALPGYDLTMSDAIALGALIPTWVIIGTRVGEQTISYDAQRWLHVIARGLLGVTIITIVVKWWDIHDWPVVWLVIFPLAMLAMFGVFIWAILSGPDCIRDPEEVRQHLEDGEPALYRRWDPIEERWAWYSAMGTRYGYDPEPRPAPRAFRRRRDPIWPPAGER
jgi:hypothetical protein